MYLSDLTNYVTDFRLFTSIVYYVLL